MVSKIMLGVTLKEMTPSLLYAKSMQAVAIYLG
jgi:hypothetical protein